MTPEYQYLRRTFPPPSRTLYRDCIVHYFHTDTREYLGSEVVVSGEITLARFDAECVIDSCACAECLRDPEAGRRGGADDGVDAPESAIDVAAAALDRIPADLRPATLVNRDRATAVLGALDDAGYTLQQCGES